MKKRTATIALIAAAFSFSPFVNAEDGDKKPPRGDRERPEGGRPLGRPGGDRPGGGGDMFKIADADNDGKITLKEWKAAAAKRAEESFKRLDADGKGHITMEDLEKMRERFRRGGGGRPEGRSGGDRPEGRPEGRGPRDGEGDGARRPKRPEAE